MLAALRHNFLVAAPIYVFGGLLIAILGRVILHLSHVVENRCTKTAKGYILENKQVTHKNRTLHYPMVAFEINGIHYTILYKLGTKFSKYHAGQSVDIKINPGDYTEIFIETDKSRSYEKFGEWLMVFGILIFAASAITYLCLYLR